ncbi:MAG: phage major capsid protein [Pseudomonadota bacterium]
MSNTMGAKAPETKSAEASPGEISNAFDSFLSAFDEFKQTNNDRLNQIEKRFSADVVTTEKLDRINTAIDEQKQHLDGLIVKGGRPFLGEASSRSYLNSEHTARFDDYVRKGDETGLRTLEAKAFSIGSDPDGGYLVPDELSAEIGTRLKQLSPMRSVASIRQVSGSVYKKPFAQSGPAVGWVGETDARPQTATPTLAELQFPTMELYAMPAATPSLLDDAAIDVDQWLAQEVEAAFSEQESTAFISGDGVNKPTGLLNYPTVAEASWSWGNLGYVATGVDGAFASSDASDVLVDTVYAAKAGYRQNASWMMNRKVQAEIRKLKDADGNYLWQPPATVGGNARLMGFQVVESEDMPDIATDTTSIAFGDFSRGYLIVDRAGVAVLRDPYSAKPYVLFYTTKRVGGGVQDFDAIKFVKFGTA